MKIINAVALNKVLADIADASAKTPAYFSMPVKLAAAVAMRQTIPIAEDYEKMRVDLIKSLGAESKETPGQWSVTPENTGQFTDQVQTLAAAEVAPAFRKIKESEIGDSPLTIGQLLALQEAGILVPNDPPAAPPDKP